MLLSSSNSTKCLSLRPLPSLDLLYWVVFQVIIPGLIFVGIVTNIINLIVLTRRRMMDKIYRWLRAMAIVDIILCLFTIPICMASCGHTPSAFALATYHSMFGWSIRNVFQTTSYYLMVWFAYDRYLAVCCHDKYPRSLQYEMFCKRLISTFLLSIILFTPTVLFGTVCPVVSSNKALENEVLWVPLDGFRAIDNILYETYSWIRDILTRLVPATFITIFNIKIVLRVKELQNIRESFAKGVSLSRREKERRLVFVLFGATVLFYVCNSPVFIYLAILKYSPQPSEAVLVFGAIGNIIQMIGNVSNFVLYFFTNPEFYRTLKGLRSRLTLENILGKPSQPNNNPNAEKQFQSYESKSQSILGTDDIISNCHVGPGDIEAKRNVESGGHETGN